MTELSPEATPSPSTAKPQKNRSRKLILAGAGCGCLAIVAVLAVTVAFPALMLYIKKSKSMEATHNLEALSRLVEQECSVQQSYAGIAPAGPVPPTPPAGTQATGAFLSDPGFRRVGFSPNPVIYSYSIRPNSIGGADLVAQGDIDGDGARSAFSVVCDATCRCDTSAMHIMDELE